MGPQVMSGHREAREALVTYRYAIPGLGSCPGEGIGHLLQYSWAPLVAQLIKNLSSFGSLGLLSAL